MLFPDGNIIIPNMGTAINADGKPIAAAPGEGENNGKAI